MLRGSGAAPPGSPASGNRPWGRSAPRGGLPCAPTFAAAAFIRAGTWAARTMGVFGGNPADSGGPRGVLPGEASQPPDHKHSRFRLSEVCDTLRPGRGRQESGCGVTGAEVEGAGRQGSADSTKAPFSGPPSPSGRPQRAWLTPVLAQASALRPRESLRATCRCRGCRNAPNGTPQGHAGPRDRAPGPCPHHQHPQHCSTLLHNRSPCRWVRAPGSAPQGWCWARGSTPRPARPRPALGTVTRTVTSPLPLPNPLAAAPPATHHPTAR